MPTLRDVAKQANVTVTTVSRVLNNRGAISEKTAKRVMEAMQEIGYHPNEAARSLSGKSSNIIGVIVPNTSNPYFSSVVNQIEQYAYARGFKTILCNSNHQKSKEREYFSMLHANKVAGIVFASRTQEFSEFVTSSFPVVFLERFVSNKFSSVACDNYQGGILAAEHLVACGCKNLVHIGGVVNLAMPADDRARGFIDVCKARGIRHYVVSTQEQHFRNMKYEEIIESILQEDPSIDGIFASSDVIAAAVLHVCYHHRISVPDQLQLVGFDDTPLADLLTPRLTTIQQPIEQLCRLSVDAIIDQRNGNAVPSRTVLNVQLIQRETTRLTSDETSSSNNAAF